MERLTQIKEDLFQELFLFELDYSIVGDTLNIKVDNVGMYQIQNLKNGVKIAAFTGSKPLITMIVLSTIYKHCEHIEIAPDFTYNSDYDIVDINYVRTDKNATNH